MIDLNELNNSFTYCWQGAAADYAVTGLSFNPNGINLSDYDDTVDVTIEGQYTLERLTDTISNRDVDIDFYVANGSSIARCVVEKKRSLLVSGS